MTDATKRKMSVKFLVRYHPDGTVAVLSAGDSCAIDVAVGVDGQRAAGKEHMVAGVPQGRKISARRPHNHLTLWDVVRRVAICSLAAYLIPVGPVHVPRCVGRQVGSRPTVVVRDD